MVIQNTNAHAGARAAPVAIPLARGLRTGLWCPCCADDPTRSPDTMKSTFTYPASLPDLLASVLIPIAAGIPCP